MQSSRRESPSPLSFSPSDVLVIPRVMTSSQTWTESRMCSIERLDQAAVSSMLRRPGCHGRQPWASLFSAWKPNRFDYVQYIQREDEHWPDSSNNCQEAVWRTLGTRPSRSSQCLWLAETTLVRRNVRGASSIPRSGAGRHEIRYLRALEVWRKRTVLQGPTSRRLDGESVGTDRDKEEVAI